MSGVSVHQDLILNRKRSPFPYEGKALAHLSGSETNPVEWDTFLVPASKALPRCSTADERSHSLNPAGRSPSPPAAVRRWGGLEGVTPSAPFMARTQASDGHCAYTRAARSAGLRFAVRSLFEAIDREINKVRRPGWHLIHREAVPLPLVGATADAVLTSSTTTWSPFPS